MQFLPKSMRKQSEPNPTEQFQARDRTMLEVSRRSSKYSWIVFIGGFLLIGGIWLFLWQQINYEYNRSITQAANETQNLAIAFEEHVRRIMIEMDGDLISLKRAYELEGISSSVIVNFGEALTKDPSRNLVAIYNEQGVVVASYIQNALGLNRSNRDYFTVHQDANNQGLVIGKPITGLMSGQNTIPLTRRINKPDGSFGGIVFIGLRSDYLLNFYQKMNLGQNQLIALVGIDWIVRARQSGDNLEVGQDVTNSPLWNNVQLRPYGTS